MKTKYSSIRSALCAASFAVALVSVPMIVDKALLSADTGLSLSSSVHAQGDSAKKKVTRRLPGIGQKVLKGLGKVTEYANPDTEKNPNAKPNFRAAAKELAKLERQCGECNNYEKAQIYQMYAYVSYSLENYSDAIKHYKNVIKQSPQIPIGVELSSLQYISQLSFQLERYDEAVSYFDRRVKLADESGNPLGPQDWQFKAIICYQGDKLKCAFDNISKAIDMVEAKGKIAEESWYNIQRQLHLGAERYKPATAILEKLIRHYPKKSYWEQLGSMYGLLERPKDQLQAMDLTYLMGGLTKEKSLVNLAYLYIADEVPYRGARIIEKGMADKVIPRTEENLDILATAWTRAKEAKKAIPVLQEVGKVSKSGNVYVDLMSLHLDLNQPRKAIEYGKLALKKGNFTRGADGEAHINLGIAYFDLKQYSNAINSFQKASKIKKHEKFARTWLRYAENEKKRYEGLKKSLAASGLDINQVIR